MGTMARDGTQEGTQDEQPQRTQRAQRSVEALSRRNRRRIGRVRGVRGVRGKYAAPQDPRIAADAACAPIGALMTDDSVREEERDE